MYSFKLISDANNTFSSQYRGELASHLPMALVALEKLGASNERLDAYRDQYAKRLEPKQSDLGLKLTAQNWHEYLGRNKYHSEYLDYFTTSLERTDLRQTLNAHLPKLFCGVGGGAFHGVIRLGYALETKNLEEIYQALGYWAVSYLDLEVQESLEKSATKTPSQIIAELSQEFLGFKVDAPNIARRLQTIGRLERFQYITSQLDEAKSSYKELAPLVLSLFAQTLDFTALHAVTSMHAFRILMEHAPQLDTSASRRNLFVALAAAYVSIRAPLVTPREITAQNASWDALIAAAIQSNDDHIPKIVFTCREEYSYSGNPSYLEAAKRYLDKFK